MSAPRTQDGLPLRLLDGAAEEFALAEDVLLAGNLGEREGTHAGSQRFVCAR